MEKGGYVRAGTRGDAETTDHRCGYETGESRQKKRPAPHLRKDRKRREAPHSPEIELFECRVLCSNGGDGHPPNNASAPKLNRDATHVHLTYGESLRDEGSLSCPLKDKKRETLLRILHPPSTRTAAEPSRYCLDLAEETPKNRITMDIIVRHDDSMMLPTERRMFMLCLYANCRRAFGPSCSLGR